MTPVVQPGFVALARTARVGDLLPDDLLGAGALRRLDATALLQPGERSVAAYLAALEAGVDEFAAWNGRVAVLEPDGGRRHRLLIVDRYGQVYDVVETADASALPSAGDLREWFRFLATACPECGVIDDPLPGAYVP